MREITRARRAAAYTAAVTVARAIDSLRSWVSKLDDEDREEVRRRLLLRQEYAAALHFDDARRLVT